MLKVKAYLICLLTLSNQHPITTTNHTPECQSSMSTWMPDNVLMCERSYTPDKTEDELIL